MTHAAPVDRRFDAGDLSCLRAELAATATRLGASDASVERLLIVASELATNAIRHGGGAGRLRLWRDGSRLCCQVSDCGPGLGDARRGTRRPSPSAIGGRGLWLCRQLSDSLDIVRRDRQTIITSTIEAERD